MVTKERSGPLEGGGFLFQVWHAPESSLLVFGTVFNFMWEVLQKPLFFAMAEMTPRQSALQCLAYSFRDGLMLVAMFWIVALLAGSRKWATTASRRHVLAFIATGLLWTFLLEMYHLRRGDWTYSRQMPLLPVVGVGVVPVLQWVFLPPLVLLVVRIQVLGVSTLGQFHSKQKGKSHE